MIRLASLAVVIVGGLLAGYGLMSLSQATMGVGLIAASACALILARMLQSSAHSEDRKKQHKSLMDAIDELAAQKPN